MDSELFCNDARAGAACQEFAFIHGKPQPPKRLPPTSTDKPPPLDWLTVEQPMPRPKASNAALTMSGIVQAIQTERAYRRGDALEKRRAQMEAWAAYCEPKAGNVVSIARRPH
jgi:hypothetical protein